MLCFLTCAQYTLVQRMLKGLFRSINSGSAAAYVLTLQMPAASALPAQGNPDALFTLTSLEDVGKWTAEALLDPASK